MHSTSTWIFINPVLTLVRLRLLIFLLNLDYSFAEHYCDRRFSGRTCLCFLCYSTLLFSAISLPFYAKRRIETVTVSLLALLEACLFEPS